MTVDQSAEFDCVKHPILLEKLMKYSVCEEVISWIASYLSENPVCEYLPGGVENGSSE